MNRAMRSQAARAVAPPRASAWSTPRMAMRTDGQPRGAPQPDQHARIAVGNRRGAGAVHDQSGCATPDGIPPGVVGEGLRCGVRAPDRHDDPTDAGDPAERPRGCRKDQRPCRRARFAARAERCCRPGYGQSPPCAPGRRPAGWTATGPQWRPTVHDAACTTTRRRPRAAPAPTPPFPTREQGLGRCPGPGRGTRGRDRGQARAAPGPPRRGWTPREEG